jgi:DNA-binding transcriptional LysR family regulator
MRPTEWGRGQFAPQQRGAAYVSDGSISDLRRCWLNVRFALDSGHRAGVPEGPGCANRRHRAGHPLSQIGASSHAIHGPTRSPPVELLAAFCPTFPLKSGKIINVSSLAPHPLLLLDFGFVVRRTFDAVCRIAKLKPKILIESRAPSNLLALAEAGHGIAVIPSVVLTHRYDLQVARITHEGKPLREPLSIVWDNRPAQPSRSC